MLGGSVEKFGVTDKDDIKWMSPRVGVQPLNTFTSALKLSAPLEKSLTIAYVQLSDNRPHFNEAAERAKQLGFEVHKFLEGGHDAMITRPADLARLLIEIM